MSDLEDRRRANDDFMIFVHEDGRDCRRCFGTNTHQKDLDGPIAHKDKCDLAYLRSPLGVHATRIANRASGIKVHAARQEDKDIPRMERLRLLGDLRAQVSELLEEIGLMELCIMSKK